ncbi:NAD(P)-binding protein [Mesobacillus maritimus]|uniref:precorrin-2 dehydrogenase n=1 Tax=Mesobacillus maritimus TaxID=1643336 RepID=A0ABS7K056_9BACI|nr:NAD(P)-binding protein [Mesobacillus maritimus]MBY0095631.1 NAD(P)-binding protein [Mesobacillus maritimus]
MNEYPVMIRLKGKKITVIGGGKVAERKILSLLQAEGVVEVISPSVTEKIQTLAQTAQLKWVKKEFEHYDVKSSFLVIAATNRREINQQVAEAVNEYQLVNIVDNPEKSNFIVPSSHQQGKLTIAVSTSGSSPSLAKKIKNELAQQFDETYAEYLDFLHNCRDVVKLRVEKPEIRRQLLKLLLEDEFLALTKNGQLTERNQRFLSLLEDITGR